MQSCVFSNSCSSADLAGQQQLQLSETFFAHACHAMFCVSDSCSSSGLKAQQQLTASKIAGANAASVAMSGSMT